MTGTEILVAILGTASVAAVFGAVVTGLFNRRKLGAEATQVITEAAKGVVERIQAELDRKTADFSRERERFTVEVQELRAAHKRQAEEFTAELEARETRWRRIEEDWRQALQLHAAWDALAVQHAGSALPSVPPLYPPQKVTGHRDRLTPDVRNVN